MTPIVIILGGLILAVSSAENPSIAVQSEIDSLKAKREMLEIEIRSIEKKIDSLQVFLIPEPAPGDTMPSYSAYLKSDCRLYGEASAASRMIRFLELGTPVIVLGREESMVRIAVFDTVGYVRSYLVGTAPGNLRHRKFLRKKYGVELGDLIAAHQLRIGMTKAMVIEAIGRPRQMNRTVTEYGISEQWVYDSRYVYFEDGILSAWQESR